MVDFNKLISSVTGSGIGSGLAGGVAGGALVSALTTKSGRKTAISALQSKRVFLSGLMCWD